MAILANSQGEEAARDTMNEMKTRPTVTTKKISAPETSKTELSLQAPVAANVTEAMIVEVAEATAGVTAAIEVAVATEVAAATEAIAVAAAIVEIVADTEVATMVAIADEA